MRRASRPRSPRPANPGVPLVARCRQHHVGQVGQRATLLQPTMAAACPRKLGRRISTTGFASLGGSNPFAGDWHRSVSDPLPAYPSPSLPADRMSLPPPVRVCSSFTLARCRTRTTTRFPAGRVNWKSCDSGGMGCRDLRAWARLASSRRSERSRKPETGQTQTGNPSPLGQERNLGRWIITPCPSIPPPSPAVHTLVCSCAGPLITPGVRLPRGGPGTRTPHANPPCLGPHGQCCNWPPLRLLGRSSNNNIKRHARTDVSSRMKWEATELRTRASTVRFYFAAGSRKPAPGSHAIFPFAALEGVRGWDRHGLPP